jgi:hypothetical protein
MKSKRVEVPTNTMVLNLINHTSKTAKFVSLYFWSEYVLGGNLTGIQLTLLQVPLRRLDRCLVMR